MEIKIRRAKKEDCAQMMDLINELAEYEHAPEKVTVSFAHFVESGFGPQPVWWAFVAEAEGQIAGMALYYIRYSTWKGQRLYLEDLVIRKDMRRKGIGKMLFDRLIREAKERKLKGMNWQVLEWNTPAIDFYKTYQAELDPEWINGGLEFE